VSTTSIKLLQAASQIVGGNRALARRLGIGEALLSKFLSGGQGLPDHLLLRAVDIILEERQARILATGGPAAPTSDASQHDR
jgi:hypothetical protein